MAFVAGWQETVRHQLSLIVLQNAHFRVATPVSEAVLAGVIYSTVFTPSRRLALAFPHVFSLQSRRGLPPGAELIGLNN